MEVKPTDVGRQRIHQANISRKLGSHEYAELSCSCIKESSRLSPFGDLTSYLRRKRKGIRRAHGRWSSLACLVADLDYRWRLSPEFERCRSEILSLQNARLRLQRNILPLPQLFTFAAPQKREAVLSSNKINFSPTKLLLVFDIVNFVATMQLPKGGVAKRPQVCLFVAANIRRCQNWRPLCRSKVDI